MNYMVIKTEIMINETRVYNIFGTILYFSDLISHIYSITK